MHNSIGKFKKYEYIAMSSVFLVLLHFPMFFQDKKSLDNSVSHSVVHGLDEKDDPSRVFLSEFLVGILKKDDPSRVFRRKSTTETAELTDDRSTF